MAKYFSFFKFQLLFLEICLSKNECCLWVMLILMMLFSPLKSLYLNLGILYNSVLWIKKLVNVPLFTAVMCTLSNVYLVMFIIQWNKLSLNQICFNTSLIKIMELISALILEIITMEVLCLEMWKMNIILILLKKKIIKRKIK